MLIECHRFPMFYQLLFRADWLLSKPVSGQKFVGRLQDSNEPKRWTETELPILYTPINSIEILR